MKDLPGIAFTSLVAGMAASWMIGIANAQHGPPCRENCELEIIVASQGPPGVPPGQERFRVENGQPITIHLKGPGANRRVTLVFEEPAFVDRQGNLLYAIQLRPGRQTFTTRPAPACPPAEDENEPGGCKYTVVDLGDQTREVLDPWIIID